MRDVGHEVASSLAQALGLGAVFYQKQNVAVTDRAGASLDKQRVARKSGVELDRNIHWLFG